MLYSLKISQIMKLSSQRLSLNLVFLLLGGAGSIGQVVTKEIFKRNPKNLHVVDVNENNMADLVLLNTMRL